MTDNLTSTAVKHLSSKQRTKRSHAEEAFVELLRTTDLLSRGVAQVLKRARLSWTQYNVLRILRGAPEGLPCGEIAGRMITRDPDITRLLDRLERRGLVSRSRQSTDRRTVITQITPAGVQVLAGLDLPIRQAHISQLGHLGRKRLQILTELLRSCRHQAM
jgi:DNA-binding MarR family transcriptional regulator